jgi:RNA polymerase sigma-70 factor (ECF subfamily)
MSRAHVDLVRRAASGDARSLDALVARHLPGLIAFVRANAGTRLRAREATLDLVQSACYEALKAMPNEGVGDEAGFKHWFYLAAERKIVDRARYHAAQKRSPSRETPLGSEIDLIERGLIERGYSGFWTPSRQAAAREEIEQMEAALRRLPDDQREVIVLARIVGLPHAEIGERLGRSEGAVRVLLHRALARLAVLMCGSSA